MDNNPVVPPSLIGAGVATQPQAPQSMIGALRSQGSMPAEAMQQMAPQANLGLAFASGVLNPNAPQNPYLAQQAQMANQQQVQQTHMAAIAQKAQQARQAQELKRNELSLRVYDEALKTLNDPGQRLNLLKQRNGLFKQLGIPPLSGGVIQDLAEKNLSPEKIDEIRTRLKYGTDPVALAKMYGVAPSRIQEIAQLPSNPARDKAMGLKTDAERQEEGLKLREKEITVWAKEKGIKLDSPVYQRMTELAKRPINEMTDTEVQSLKAQAEKDVHLKEVRDKLDLVRQEEDIKHRNRMAEIDRREADKVKDKPALTPALKNQSIKLQSEYVALPLKEERAKQVKEAVALLSKEGIIQKGDTLVDVAAAKYNRATKVGREDINKAIQTLNRYGTAMLVGAERDLGMQAGSLRLKIIAEAEAGNILAIPRTGWDDFFSVYDRGLGDRKDLIEQQLETMGVDIPQPKSQRKGPLDQNVLPPDKVQALKAAGYSDEQIDAYKKAKGFK